MKLLMICNTDGALYVFRKPIIEAVLTQGHEVVSISGRSTYFESLEKMGVQPMALDFSRHSVALSKNLRLIHALLRMVKASRPDVVHCFTHKPAIYGTLAARLAGCRKIFVTITGLGTLFIRNDKVSVVLRLLLMLQYRFALRFASKVFFQNADDLELFVSKRILPAEKAILTHGSGIDLQQYPLPSQDDMQAARSMLSSELGFGLEGKRVVIFPARGVREKGFFEFYEAAQAINQVEPGRYAFVHLGLIDADSSRGLSKDNVQDFAHRCGVHYLGFKENIDEYMYAADVIVLPSYREGTPRSLIEALALGKAIVTTDTPGCRETVVERWNGLLCKVADVRSLVSALLAIDEEFVSRARLRSRSLCESKYDASMLVDLTLKKYLFQD
jgi:N,N'-diacetylbacillosaminyl-diphospho-undecaprenol alpha-1,3-N-acetylgalactosaminyltransferase